MFIPLGQSLHLNMDPKLVRGRARKGPELVRGTRGEYSQFGFGRERAAESLEVGPIYTNFRQKMGQILG